jgi:hypothetical protein
MITSGFLVNKTSRHVHIFKRAIRPGQKIPLKELYNQYKYKCNCPFDEKFIRWLKENKVPRKGWEIEDLKTIFDEPVRVVSEVVKVDDKFVSVQSEWTANAIAELKLKDKPRKVLSTIGSIFKLRRALTLVNKKKGKQFLAKMIKSRIKSLQKKEEEK